MDKQGWVFSRKKILKITTSDLISGGFLVMKYHCVAAAASGDGARRRRRPPPNDEHPRLGTAFRRGDDVGNGFQSQGIWHMHD